MGLARIISGGDDGRYTIELDYGAAQKTALLNAITRVIADLDTAIAGVLVDLAAAEAEEAEAQAQIDELTNAYVAALQLGEAPDPAVLAGAIAQRSALQSINAPIRRKLAALKLERASQVKRAGYWENFQATTQRQAWCCDYTENAAAGVYVATAEIPGDSSLVLVAPGARAWTSADGVLTATDVMSPEQAFVNAALLPGWQKYQPTYRWGTLTAINREADTGNVSLFTQLSVAQRLPVNQTSTLTNVPIVYMTCNSDPFEVGDRVVVQFQGQDWSAPRIIGFVDNPQPCVPWPDVVVDLNYQQSLDSDTTRPWVIIQVDSACGITGARAEALETTQGGTAGYEWTNASIVGAPVGFSLSATYPPAFTFGYFSMLGGTTGAASSRVPKGASPGRALVLSYSFGALTASVRSFPFADVTVNEYNSGTCTINTTYTHPYLTLQALGDSIEAAYSYAYTEASLFNGPINELVGTPTIHVTHEGRTREYEIYAYSGSAPAKGYFRPRRS